MSFGGHSGHSFPACCEFSVTVTGIFLRPENSPCGRSSETAAKTRKANGKEPSEVFDLKPTSEEVRIP